MDVLKCIKQRRSIRNYKMQDVDEKLIQKLLDAARYAPFGGPTNIECQLWEFIIIRDPATKLALTHGNEERQFVGRAPVVIACCADTTRDPAYRDYDITVALATENIMLSAVQMGLGSCYVTCYGNHVAHKEERRLLRKILKLPDHIRLVCLITLGYPDEKPSPKPLRKLDKMIHYESW